MGSTYETHPYGELTVTQKLGTLLLLGKAACSALYALMTYPFAGDRRAPTLLKHCMFSGMKTFLNAASFRSYQWLEAPTSETYARFAKKKGFKPQSQDLGGGAKAHWLGPKEATRVLVFFPGGGYVHTPAEHYFHYVHECWKQLQQKHEDVSACFVEYTLIQQASWPKQLQQAASVIRSLIEDQGKKPENLLIVGDSAGGNLVLALLSHILHPYPTGIPPLKIQAPFAGVLLMSPWTDFSVTDESHRQNYWTDILDDGYPKVTSDLWAAGGGDEYSEPVTASENWWDGLEEVARNVLIWVGGGEVLRDGILKFAAKMESGRSNVTTIISPGSCHEEPIVDCSLGYPKTETAEAVESWMVSQM